MKARLPNLSEVKNQPEATRGTTCAPPPRLTSRLLTKIGLTLALAALAVAEMSAQINLWSAPAEGRPGEIREFVPDLPDLARGAVLQLDLDGMIALAKTAKKEEAGPGAATAVVWLPLPDGSFQRFQLWESPLMEPELAAKFPEIKSYLIKGVDDPHASGRLMTSPYEFGAFFASPPNNREAYIRKIYKNDAAQYISFWGKDDPFRQQPQSCLWEGGSAPADDQQHRMPGANDTGDMLRVFRLAMTVTGKLAENQGWTTKAQALAALVSFLGQINTIYERDVSIRFVLPVNEENVIFLNDATDPFTAYGGGESAEENVMICSELIGTGNFDVGLAFVTGGCCAAGKPSICGDGKAWNFSPFNNVVTTAHEIGHQFNCDHT